ncbi:hypothetical protein [Plantactinospora veratri]|uniref:hypothetical protein n=1 Tax=Plantactinospora veratri TaxID=1436122 RepID=UPI002F262E2A
MSGSTAGYRGQCLRESGQRTRDDRRFDPNMPAGRQNPEDVLDIALWAVPEVR